VSRANPKTASTTRIRRAACSARASSSSRLRLGLASLCHRTDTRTASTPSERCQPTIAGGQTGRCGRAKREPEDHPDAGRRRHEQQRAQSPRNTSPRSDCLRTRQAVAVTVRR
jgi:hypothetical protein